MGLICAGAFEIGMICAGTLEIRMICAGSLGMGMICAGSLEIGMVCAGSLELGTGCAAPVGYSCCELPASNLSGSRAAHKLPPEPIRGYISVVGTVLHHDLHMATIRQVL